MKIIESELEYKLTYKDIVDIIKIIDDASCHELQIELEDLKLRIVKGNPQAPAPVAMTAVVPPAQAVSGPANRAAAGQPSAESRQETGMKPAPPEKAADKKKVKAGEEKIDGVPVLSPLTGTFYCAPEPGAKPFVEKGARVEKGQQVGIVEVMKLMNSIKAPDNGVIKEVRVKNEETVEMGQVLMTIDPS
jgi:acetyl-CoA carboxylase biotin carboxyl carrier protein